MKLKLLLVIFAATFTLAACVLETPTPTSAPTEIPAPTLSAESSTAPGGGPVKQSVNIGGVMVSQYSNVPPVTIDATAGYSASIRTNLGTMTIELFADQAPLTVNNFIFLANDEFYNGLIFHRVIPSFMIQGGDPTGTGFMGPGYEFQDELVPGLTFDRPGKLAMANSGPDTNGSQFFITTAPTAMLNGRHTIFGQITQGQDVANAISLTLTSDQDKPLTPVVIQTIAITKNP